MKNKANGAPIAANAAVPANPNNVSDPLVNSNKDPSLLLRLCGVYIMIVYKKRHTYYERICNLDTAANKHNTISPYIDTYQ